MDVDPARGFLHLTFERNRPATVPLADLQTKQLVVPPGHLGCVRVLAAAGDCDQAVPPKQQQVAVRDVLACVGERNEMWLLDRCHDWLAKRKKPVAGRAGPTTGSLDADWLLWLPLDTVNAIYPNTRGGPISTTKFGHPEHQGEAR